MRFELSFTSPEWHGGQLAGGFGPVSVSRGVILMSPKPVMLSPSARADIIASLPKIEFVGGDPSAWIRYGEMLCEEFELSPGLATALSDFILIWAGLMQQDIVLGCELSDVWQCDMDKANQVCNLSGAAVCDATECLRRVWAHGTELGELIDARK